MLFNVLDVGHIVRNEGSGRAYVVLMVDRENRRAIAVRTVEITNPKEWKIVGKTDMGPVAQLEVDGGRRCLMYCITKI